MQCKGCSAALNPYCQADYTARLWICPFCHTRNHFPGHYHGMSESNLPAELFPNYTTIEYTLPAHAPPQPPAYVFVVDTALSEDELGGCRAALTQALQMIPEYAQVKTRLKLLQYQHLQRQSCVNLATAMHCILCRMSSISSRPSAGGAGDIRHARASARAGVHGVRQELRVPRHKGVHPSTSGTAAGHRRVSAGRPARSARCRRRSRYVSFDTSMCLAARRVLPPIAMPSCSMKAKVHLEEATDPYSRYCEPEKAIDRPPAWSCAGAAQAAAAQRRRFILPLSDCEFAISGVLDELQRDAWSTPADVRPSRSTGVALQVHLQFWASGHTADAAAAVQAPMAPIYAMPQLTEKRTSSVHNCCVLGFHLASLSDNAAQVAAGLTDAALSGGTGAVRIMLFVGGPTTEGPGQVVAKELLEPIRSHKVLGWFFRLWSVQLDNCIACDRVRRAR